MIDLPYTFPTYFFSYTLNKVVARPGEGRGKLLDEGSTEPVVMCITSELMVIHRAFSVTN